MYQKMIILVVNSIDLFGIPSANRFRASVCDS